MSEADDVYAALRAFSKRLLQQQREAKEQARLDTNARRRQRYATRRAAALRANGTPPTRPAKPQHDPDYEPDLPHACYCHAAVFPPCRWCEDGGNHDEEDDET